MLEELVSPAGHTIDWNVDWPPISEMNCLGRLSRDSGQTRVPEPPHMIIGSIFLITLSSVWRPGTENCVRLCLKLSGKATQLSAPFGLPQMRFRHDPGYRATVSSDH
jgi:hypothetical protein